MPVVDQIRLMKAIADAVGHKKLKNKILSNFTRKLSFQEAIERRLNPILGATRRTQPGQRPDGIALHEPMRGIIHIGKRRAVLRPVSAEVPHNRTYLAPRAAQSKNTVETTQFHKPVPTAAQEPVIEMRRMKWPKQERPEDDEGIFRLVELPDGVCIAHAQIGEIPPYSAFAAAQSKNPIETMAQPEIAPHKARGDGHGP